jgi:hypothetical protein
VARLDRGAARGRSGDPDWLTDRDLRAAGLEPDCDGADVLEDRARHLARDGDGRLGKRLTVCEVIEEGGFAHHAQMAAMPQLTASTVMLPTVDAAVTGLGRGPHKRRRL